MNSIVKYPALAFSLLLLQGPAFTQNVGIGTANPQKKLHVEGSTYLKDSLAIGTLNPQANLHVSGQAGLLVSGSYVNGTAIPNLGSGSRLAFFPNKSAFRAGTASGTEWDDANVGAYSVALGRQVTASGINSFATGALSQATAEYAIAMGYDASASGQRSLALGMNAVAGGLAATALGMGSVATGDYAIAIGNNSTADAPNSMALGYYTRTNGQLGSVVIGDGTWGGSFTSSDATNQMMMRFSGGYKLFSDMTHTTAGMLSFKGGNLGIGTNAATSYKLYATTANTGAALLEGSNTAGTALDLKNTTTGGRTWSLLSSGSAAAGGAGQLQFKLDNGTIPLTLKTDGNVQLNGDLLLPSSGGTASPLDHYEETTGTINLTNGSNNYLPSYTIKLLRVGKQVTLTLPTDVLNLTVSGVSDIQLNPIPARFRPATNIYLPLRIRNNGVDDLGLLLIRTDGVAYLKPSAAGGVWSGNINTGYCGFFATALTYSIQ